MLAVALVHQSFNSFADNFWQPPLLSAGSQLSVSIVGGIVMLALVIVVYGIFKRAVRVENPERFVHPELGGTWRY